MAKIKRIKAHENDQMYISIPDCIDFLENEIINNKELNQDHKDTLFTLIEELKPMQS